MRPVWERTGGKDGYVSIEVDPTLAYETQATFDQAVRFHEEIDKPNLMVKIPATRPGLPAIEDMHRAGQVDQHHADLLAPALQGGRRGAPARARAARRRWRRPVERRLGRELLRLARRHRGRQAARRAVGHHAAEGEARRSRTRSSRTAHWLEAYSGPRWEFLAGKGATKQRCLWASTSTKNPDYRDVMYVEELIAPETVNTMPNETIEAFQDHGEVKPNSALDGLAEARGADRGARGRGRRLRRRRRDARGRGRAEVRRLVRPSCSTGSGPSARSSWRLSDDRARRARPPDLGPRRVGLDRQGRGEVARLARRAGRACARSSASSRASPSRRPTTAPRSSCSAWAARASPRR